MIIELAIEGQWALFLIILAVLVIGISLHEFGHALAADLQGDPTPRLAGRLTVNPKSHLDPIGTFALVIAGFGWGKPVEFSLRNLRNKRAGGAIVALAGPTMNLLLALFGAFLAARVTRIDSLAGVFALQLAHFNVILAIFNMLPIPPLDGSRLLTLFLPPAKQHVIYFLDKWGFLILLAVIFLFAGALQRITLGATKQLLALFGATLLPP